MSTVKELLRDVRKAMHVFGYVAYNRDDGKYIRLVKSDIQYEFETMPRDVPVEYTFNGVDLYIN